VRRHRLKCFLTGRSRLTRRCTGLRVKPGDKTPCPLGRRRRRNVNTRKRAGKQKHDQQDQAGNVCQQYAVATGFSMIERHHLRCAVVVFGHHAHVMMHTWHRRHRIFLQTNRDKRRNQDQQNSKQGEPCCFTLDEMRSVPLPLRVRGVIVNDLLVFG